MALQELTRPGLGAFFFAPDLWKKDVVGSESLTAARNVLQPILDELQTSVAVALGDRFLIEQERNRRVLTCNLQASLQVVGSQSNCLGGSHEKCNKSSEVQKNTVAYSHGVSLQEGCRLLPVYLVAGAEASYSLTKWTGCEIVDSTAMEYWSNASATHPMRMLQCHMIFTHKVTNHFTNISTS